MKPIQSSFGGGNQFANNLINYLFQYRKDYEIVYTLDDSDIDVIFMMDPRILKYNKIDLPKVIEYKRLHPKVRVIHRVNDCDKPRGNVDVLDPVLFNAFEIDDLVVFVSKWTADYFIDKGFRGDYIVINNGCNNNFFYESRIPRKIEYVNGKRKIRLVTHHWSSNWNKGFKMYRKIDKYLDEHPEIEFTFIGREFNSLFTPNNIKVVGPYYGLELANKIRENDIYVTASKFENCPMHVIEGLSCGLPILYHEDLGGGVEICKDYGMSYKDFKDFVLKLWKIVDMSYKINYKNLSSENCSKNYVSAIEGLLYKNIQNISLPYSDKYNKNKALVDIKRIYEKVFA